jgi:hypothetical protein
MKPLHAPFWETIPLAAMSVEQWEALCDLCGKCCLEKLEEEESGRIFYTNVACKLLDPASGRCGNYGQRSRLVHDCIELSPANVANPHWLPTTCAYRRLREGRPLPAWHPLLSGDPTSVHRAGQSVAGRVIPPAKAGDLLHHLIDWIE